MPVTRRFVLTAALATAACTLAGSALAEGDGGGKNWRKRFPMKGSEFVTRVEDRLKRVNERVEKFLAKSKLSDEAKNAIRADVAARAETIRKAAAEAAKDGTVTVDEARVVRKLTKKLRADLADKHGMPRGGGGRRGGKDEGKG